MSEPKENNASDRNVFHGALKLDVSTSTPIVSAGKEFSIYVVIRNPFSMPIMIYSTETHIPIELSDEIWRKSQSSRLQKEYIEKTAKIDTLSAKFWERMKYLFLLLENYVMPDTGPRVAVAVTPELYTTLTKIEPAVIFQQVEAGGDIRVDLGTDWNLNFAERHPDEINRILWEISEYKAGRKPIVLYPGNSVVQHFILKTTSWLLFTPISHIFQIQVRYEMNGTSHVETVPFSLSIRAAIASSLIGSLIGGIFGVLVNQQILMDDYMKLLRTLLTTVIFALMIVIAFARKSNVQQIVSIEDFWGGIFIGFLVGYSGETFIKSGLVSDAS
jgi:hypothetical protein